ncbi:MAG: ArsR family transcriptional regulator [Acidimicrobiales bacterium]|nr:ArsR family transcriptional regulator [Acidimicrobiales bacterium]
MTTLQHQARALGDPTRHEIFRYVAEADGPTDVAELTAHFGLNHNAIRQHLAKLVDADLVTETTAPPTGRGRPKLLYTAAPSAESRWGVTGPYERLSHLLAEIIRTGDTAVEVGRREGHRLRGDGDEPVTVADVEEAMARQGFAPETRPKRGRVDVVLQNCPFESTALDDPETVCALHLGIAQGLVEGSDALSVDELVPKDPRRAGCRLQLHVEDPA